MSDVTAIDSTTALTAADFAAVLWAISATQLLVLLDYCQAEGMATSKGDDPDLQPM